MITEKQDLCDRIEAVAEKPAYLTIKDHKEDFPSRLSFRMINPPRVTLVRCPRSSWTGSI